MSFHNTISRYLRRLANKWHAKRRGYQAHASVQVARSALFKKTNGGKIQIGMDSRIAESVIVDAQGGTIRLGRNVSLNPQCVLLGRGGITIGDNVRIAPQVGIAAFQHIFANPAAPVRTQGTTARGIVIEDDVWVGMGAKILDGVTVARGCVIGAGAVVTRSTEPFGIYTGVPARLAGWRGATHVPDLSKFMQPLTVNPSDETVAA